MLILAESSTVGWIAIAVSVVIGALSIWQAFVLQAIQRSQKQQDDARERHAAKVASMEVRLAEAEQKTHAVIEKLVDERFRTVTHQVQNVAQQFVSSLDEIKQRLADGEINFDSLANTDHRIEMSVMGKFETIKDWMRETLCTKQELVNHEQSMTRKVENMDGHIRDVQTKVAVLGASGKPKQ